MPATNRLHQTFVENVKARRAQLGLTQREVAEKLGMPQPGYARLETGGTVPSLEMVERVAAALNISPALLLARVDVPEAVA